VKIPALQPFPAEIISLVQFSSIYWIGCSNFIGKQMWNSSTNENDRYLL